MTETIVETARRHVREAEERIVHQENVLAELGRDGHDTTEAAELLATFRETLRVMREHLAEEERQHGPASGK